MMLFYHLISRPIFLQRLSEANQEAGDAVARARQTFEKYVLDVESKDQRLDRMSIYQCVRSLSRYGPTISASGSYEADIVSSPGQSINWSEEPTKGEVSDLLSNRSATTQMNIMVDGK